MQDKPSSNLGNSRLENILYIYININLYIYIEQFYLIFSQKVFFFNFPKTFYTYK